MTVRRLRGLDAAFLYLETASQHMHVTATMLFEPVAELAGAADRARLADDLTDVLVRRLVAQETFRQRVVDAPLGIAHPAWIDAAPFDPQAHVHRLTLPRPGTIDELTAHVAEIAAVALDRTRPLWELWMIDGLADERIAAVLKVHHAMLDGVAGVDVMARLFTCEPEPVAAPVAACTDTREEPSALWLAGAALLAALRTPASAVHALLHTARAVAPVVRSAVARASAAVPAILPFSAPRSTLNRALTSERVVAFGRVPLAAVKEIKTAYGVTVNDVVLAACAHALGEYLRAHGQPPTHPIVASVPVSEHVAGDAAAPGNRVSAMFVGLPIHLPSANEVVAFIHAQALGAKRIYESFGSAMLADWAELAPPVLFARAAELYSRWRLAERLPPPHSVVISNVPGPPFAMYAGPLRLVAAYPLGPVMEGAGLNISVVSYAGSVDVGLIACPRAIAAPAEIARGFERAIAELLATARADGATRVGADVQTGV